MSFRAQLATAHGSALWAELSWAVLLLVLPRVTHVAALTWGLAGVEGSGIASLKSLAVGAGYQVGHLGSFPPEAYGGLLDTMVNMI